jgi:hypothetical protein
MRQDKARFSVGIIQKDSEILLWLRDWFGGSVRDNGARMGIHIWEICGDRAPIFLSLIYGRLSKRRKAQADSTGFALYLKGRSPVGLSTNELKRQMAAYCQEHNDTTEQKNPSVRRANNSRRYHELMKDPAFREKIRLQSQPLRERMTPEQTKAFSRYQHEYYLREKRRMQDA